MFALRRTLRALTASLLCAVGGCSTDPGVPLPLLPAIEGLGSEEAAYVGSLQARLATDPGNAATLGELAHALDSYGRWEGAARLYAHQTEVNPERPEPWYHLARMRTELGRAEGALAAFDHCLTLAPAPPAAGAEWAAAYWRHGFLLLEADRLDEAAAAFARARALAPEEPSAALGLARVALQRDDPTGAITILDELVRAHPDDPRPRGLLARAYREIGEPQRAIEVGRGATIDAHDVRLVDPWSATTRLAARAYEAILNQARTRLAADDATGALEALADLHAQQPDNIVVVEILTHAACAAGRFDEALAALAHPGLADELARVELNRGIVALRRGKAQEAITHLQRAVARDGALGIAYGLLGEAYAAARRPAEAVAALETARQLGEEDARKAVLLGLLLLQLNDIEGGIIALERAGSSYPGEPTAWTNLAVAYSKNARFADAHRALGRARAIAPDHEMVPRVAQRLAELEARGASAD